MEVGGGRGEGGGGGNISAHFWGLEEENWRLGEGSGGGRLPGPVTPAIQYGFPPPRNPYLYKYLDNMLHCCCVSLNVTNNPYTYP